MCFTFCEVCALLRYLAKRHMRRRKNHQAAKQGASHRGVLSPTLNFLLSSPCFVLQGNKIFCLLSISLLVLCFGHYNIIPSQTEPNTPPHLLVPPTPAGRTRTATFTFSPFVNFTSSFGPGLVGLRERGREGGF